MQYIGNLSYRYAFLAI